MLTTNWTDTLDRLVWEAIVSGRVSGRLSGKPDKVIESGLAHIFFYGDTVYKLYKTHADKDHFIKGVLAPTTRRQAFIDHDFKLNQHFSKEVYRHLHSLRYTTEQVEVIPYTGDTIYYLVEMSRLNFNDNLHERLLRQDVDDESLYALGYETARAVDTCPIVAPEDSNWYQLATERLGMVTKFIDWLPKEFGEPIRSAEVIAVLGNHLETHREEYEGIKGSALAVNMDNHDENVFFVNGKPQFIDLLPPMSCWWFGLPYANLSNLMVNIESLHSSEAANKVKDGYFAYYELDELPTHTFAFTRAFAYLISIAHFGSVPEKREVALRYLSKIDEIAGWVEE